MIKIDQIGADRAIQLADLQSLTFRQAYTDVHSQENIEAYCLAHYTVEIAKAELSSDRTVCCIGSLESEPSGYYLVSHQACPIELDSKSSEFKLIYVQSVAYGSGLGRALYDHALTTIQIVVVPF